MSNDQFKWGIDLGGTKIEGAILDENLNPIFRERVPTGADQGYDHILGQIKNLINVLEEKSGMTCPSIGIGTPGTMDEFTGLMKNSNTQALLDRPFTKDLAALLGIPVKAANDANCFALAEALLGSVKEYCPDAKVVFGVIMGTGVGGGLIINGMVLPGRNGNTGEWGHTTLEPNGKLCYCGDYGCTETVIAGPSLERYYTEVSGAKKSLKDIYAAYKEDSDVFATQTINRLIQYFGVGIANIINTLDPDAIVIGGGVSNLDVLYNEALAAVEKHVFNSKLNTPILKPKLGDSAGVFGAALL